MRRMKSKITIVILLISFVLLCAFFIDGTKTTLLAKTYKNYEALKIFSDVLTIIQKNYVEEIDLKSLVYNAIKGMVANLDPHSAFMPPET